MKTPTLIALLVAFSAVPGIAATKEKKPVVLPAPIGWLDLHSGSRDFTVSKEDLKKGTWRLPQGALLPVFKTRGKEGSMSGQVGALNLERGSSELGWADMTSEELKPADAYPPDSELLRLLGAPYLDDFVAEHTDVARFLVHQAQGPPVLLCYVLTMPLSTAKLVIFVPDGGKYVPAGSLNITIGEMRAAITSIEIRDLVGDGSDCVISKELFRDQEQTYGKTLSIRRISNGQFQLVWQAPLDYHNLSQYNAKMKILDPPEQNIGAPGTVAKGEVTFLPRGSRQEPTWKGKVDFFVFGREKAADSVNVQKSCPWNGREFEPLRVVSEP